MFLSFLYSIPRPQFPHLSSGRNTGTGRGHSGTQSFPHARRPASPPVSMVHLALWESALPPTPLFPPPPPFIQLFSPGSRTGEEKDISCPAAGCPFTSTFTRPDQTAGTRGALLLSSHCCFLPASVSWDKDTEVRVGAGADSKHTTLEGKQGNAANLPWTLRMNLKPII